MSRNCKLLVVALAAALLCGSAWSGQRMSVNHMNSLDHSYGKGAMAFIDVVNKETNGRYVAQDFPNGQLFQNNWTLMYEMIQTGSLQVGMEAMTSVSTLNEEMAILNLPFLFENNAHLARFIASNPPVWEKWRNQLRDKRNIVVLGAFPRPARQLSCSTHMIKTPEDLKGLKLRVPGIPLYIRIFEALGAKPVPLPGGEIYSALQLGTVFGEDNSAQVQYDLKHYEIAKYFTMWDYSHDLDLLFMNKDFFDAATPEDQAIFYQAGKAWEKAGSAAADANFDVARTAMEQSGVTFYYMSEEEKEPFKKLLQPLMEQLQKEYDPDVWKQVMDGAKATAE